MEYIVFFLFLQDDKSTWRQNMQFERYRHCIRENLKPEVKATLNNKNKI